MMRPTRLIAVVLARVLSVSLFDSTYVGRGSNLVVGEHTVGACYGALGYALQHRRVRKGGFQHRKKGNTKKNQNVIATIQNKTVRKSIGHKIHEICSFFKSMMNIVSHQFPPPSTPVPPLFFFPLRTPLLVFAQGGPARVSVRRMPMDARVRVMDVRGHAQETPARADCASGQSGEEHATEAEALASDADGRRDCANGEWRLPAWCVMGSKKKHGAIDLVSFVIYDH